MEISAQELKQKILKGEDFQLIDLRENYEFEGYNIGGINIPMDDVLNNLNLINFKKTVIFCCTEGLKSKAIINVLKKKMDTELLFSLEGGINKYFEEFES